MKRCQGLHSLNSGGDDSRDRRWRLLSSTWIDAIKQWVICCSLSCTDFHVTHMIWYLAQGLLAITVMELMVHSSVIKPHCHSSIYRGQQSMCSNPWREKMLGVLQVAGLRDGGIEGGESSSIAICSCVITALGSWLDHSLLRLNPRLADQHLAWLCLMCHSLHGFNAGTSCNIQTWIWGKSGK